jgi:amidase
MHLKPRRSQPTFGRPPQRRGELSAPQLLDLYLARIERLNPLLNCFNAVYADSARAEAVAAQARLDRGETAPLLGIPVAIKDNFDIAGRVTGHGTSAATEHKRPSAN